MNLGGENNIHSSQPPKLQPMDKKENYAHKYRDMLWIFIHKSVVASNGKCMPRKPKTQRSDSLLPQRSSLLPQRSFTTDIGFPSDHKDHSPERWNEFEYINSLCLKIVCKRQCWLCVYPLYPNLKIPSGWDGCLLQ